MAFCTTAKSDLPKSVRSSLLKQANQRTRIVPYHERVVPPPVGAILDTPSLGASVSSLSSGDTGAYEDAPFVTAKKPSILAPVARRPVANRKDALQKHRRTHNPHLESMRESRKAPPAPENWQAQLQQRQRPVSTRMQRQETRDEILCKARETLQRQEVHSEEDHKPSSGKIDRNEILQLLQDDTDDNFSLNSRDFDIWSSAAATKMETEVAPSAPKPLNLPNRLPTKQLDLDSCFTGSTCSTITESVGYTAPHLETRIDIVRRNRRRLEAAYHREQRPKFTGKTLPSEATPRVTRNRRQDPPPDITPHRASMRKKSSATSRPTYRANKNDPSTLRRSTDSRAATVKATGNRLRNITRDASLYSKKILRDDHSEHEI